MFPARPNRVVQNPLALVQEQYGDVVTALDTRGYMKKVSLAVAKGTEEVSVGMLIWLIQKIPAGIEVAERYKILQFLLKAVPWKKPKVLSDPKDRLKGRTDLYWSTNYIRLEPLPAVRFIEYKGKVMLLDDVRLARLIIEYVDRLPLFLYAPVKVYTQKYLPKTFETIFVTNNLEVRAGEETRCDECKSYDRTVQIRPVWGKSIETRLCDGCAKSSRLAIKGK